MQVIEYSYPDATTPSGIVERGVGDEWIERIRSAAAVVGAGLAGRRMDCLYSAKAWYDTLCPLGTPIALIAGWGEHTETVPRTPPDRISGYQTTNDGIVRHWWTLIGVDSLVFDPTAHQFDDRGGIQFSRYVIEGRSIEEWRGLKSRA